MKKITDIEFTEIPLLEVLHHLKDKLDVQFFIDERSLSEASIPLDSPVTLVLKRIPVETLLELMLHQRRLGYTVRNGLIIVSTEEASPIVLRSAFTACPKEARRILRN